MADLDMMLDRLDDAGRPIGLVSRRAVFAAAANFRVAHVFLFNGRSELLLQQIAPGLRHAGAWGSSAAGYLAAGEDAASAAARKASEELNLPGLPLTLFGSTEMLDSGCKKFIGLFTAVHDGPIHVDPASAAQTEFVGLARLNQLRRNGGREFTSTFLHLIDYFQGGGGWQAIP